MADAHTIELYTKVAIVVITVIVTMGTAMANSPGGRPYIDAVRGKLGWATLDEQERLENLVMQVELDFLAEENRRNIRASRIRETIAFWAEEGEHSTIQEVIDDLMSDDLMSVPKTKSALKR